jgi:hypothetical protein
MTVCSFNGQARELREALVRGGGREVLLLFRVPKGIHKSALVS